MKPQIWFFDNKESNAPYKSNKRIKFVKVVDSGDNYNHTKLSDCFKEVNSNFIRQTIPTENIDVDSGVTLDQLLELIKNVDLGLVEVVVFDWDRTLTKIEGFWNIPGKQYKSIRDYKKKLSKYPQFEGFDKMSDKLIMELYFNPDGLCIPDEPDELKRAENLVENNLDGSDNFIYRPTWLAWALNELKAKKIPTFILTNNPIADPKTFNSRELLQDFLKKMGVTFSIKNIIFNDIDLPYLRSKYKSRKEYVIMEEIIPMIDNQFNNNNSLKSIRLKRKKSKKVRRDARRDMYKKTEKKGIVDTIMGYFSL